MDGNPRFDVLLFDLGGVLMDFAGFEELRRLLPGSLRRSEVRDRWIHSPAVQRFERGGITARRFAEAVIEDLEISLEPPEFLAAFVEWARPPYPGAIELLQRLGKHYRIAALSNANELHTPLHRKRFEHVIDRLYFSDQIGSVKPEPEIFRYVIADLAVPASKIAFFDDTDVNVAAGRAAGMAAFEVDGLAALEAQLLELGMLSPTPAP
jgi:putative hydrolase of the HAD superfamily